MLSTILINAFLDLTLSLLAVNLTKREILRGV